MEIRVQELNQEQLKKMGVFNWPIWEKGISCFDWHYDDIEECYLLQGRVIVTLKGGESVSFSKGDFVTFPKGLSCTWDIKEPVKKHYTFK